MQKVYLVSDSRKQSWKVRQRKGVNDVGFIELVIAGHQGSIPLGNSERQSSCFRLTPTPRCEGAWGPYLPALLLLEHCP